MSAADIITNAADTSVKPKPIAGRLEGIHIKPRVSVPRVNPIFIKPSTIVSHFNIDITFMGAIIANNAVDNIRIPAAELIIPEFFTKWLNAANSPNNIPTEVRPLVISSHFKSPKDLTACPRIRIEVANAINFIEPLPSIFFINKLTAVISANNTLMPTIPTFILSTSISDKDLTAFVNTNIAAAKLNTPFSPLPPNLVIKIIDVVRATNIPPIPDKAYTSLSTSIVDNNHTDAAIAPIAAANFSKVDALRFFCQLLSESLIPSKAPVTLSAIALKGVICSEKLFKAWPTFFKKLPIFKKNLPATKPPRRCITSIQSIFLTKFLTVSTILPNFSWRISIWSPNLSFTVLPHSTITPPRVLVWDFISLLLPLISSTIPLVWFLTVSTVSPNLDFTILKSKFLKVSITFLPISITLSRNSVAFLAITSKGGIAALRLLKSIGKFIQSANSCILPIILSNNHTIPFVTDSTNPISDVNPIILDTKFPKNPPTLATISPNALNKDMILGISFNGCANTLTTILITEKIPWNPFCTPSKALGLHLIFSVKLANAFVISANLAPVIGGNTLSQAFPIDPNILPKLVAILAKPFIKSVLPPNSFHSANMLFLLSADFCIISPKALEIPVNKALASSKSPIMYSHVWVQPDCTASLVVSINWENVFTSVAAALAIWPSSIIRWASASV